MQLLRNPFRHSGLPPRSGLAQGHVIADPAAAQALWRRCPAAAPTPLRELPHLAQALGVEALHLKDESGRMGLGSFKALGAAHAIAREAALRADGADGPAPCERLADALVGEVYVCASAGNHGLSVAAGARIFGATAVVYLSDTVPAAFAARLQGFGARVVRAGRDYEASMAAAAKAADDNGWTLLSDSSWPGYVDLPVRVMEGYLIAGAEVADRIRRVPSHILLQAGVGGFAAAITAFFRARWGPGPTVIVVEPEAAPALIGSIRAGRPVKSTGPPSTMGRLDCKEPSHLALGELAREADYFATISDDECSVTVALLDRHGIVTTPSGAAGVAAVEHAGALRAALGLDGRSRLLAFVTEGPETT